MKYVRLHAIALASLALAALPAHAQAPAFPTKPVKIVVPYAPGGATDIVARVIAEQMRQNLGQPVVVENKPGANGIVALDEMMRNRDGYTLMLGNVTTNAITPVVDAKKLKFDYEKDVVVIQKLVDIPAVFVTTTTNFAPKSVAEFIDHAKKNPGKVRYGTVGAGSYPHYDMAFFAKRAGDLNMIAIHNKAGASGVINDMVTGDSQAAFLNAASTASMIKAGKLRPIAVVNSKRLADYPDVPIMKEAGFADVGTTAWQGLFGPAAAPRPVLEALFKSASAALIAPAAEEVFRKQNFGHIAAKSLDEAKTWLAGEMGTWRKITSQVKVETAE